MVNIFSTYHDAADTGTANATAVDGQATVDDVRIIKKIIVGKPVAGATLTIYNENNAYTGATTNILLKYTYPTFAAGTPATDVFDFTTNSNAGEGLQGGDGLQAHGGGSFTTSSAMQVTVLWDFANT